MIKQFRIIESWQPISRCDTHETGFVWALIRRFLAKPWLYYFIGQISRAQLKSEGCGPAGQGLFTRQSCEHDNVKQVAESRVPHASLSLALIRSDSIGTCVSVSVDLC